ncbi:flagellar basal body P-ring protein FlgI [Gilvimarinus polysaccharolyticus]|uniref:flagellar basal body P-ring protein FlgI n=1 Tax=Gilvimarinus polysaccharolyticus TaxID=863921 RepID=UPI00067350BB|nr:flagellar basal body P-ring protein FlgI [Gilvimarinus polysaccharolyticus]
MKKIPGLLLVALFTALLFSVTASAERVKDLASVAGVRSNQLIGYGLVVGLDGTGDQTTQSPFTTQSFSNMLKQFGINVPEGTRMQMKNVAAVMIHAELPAFAKPGQAIDITVSSVSNAKSLRGGTLLMSKLKGIDGNTYAIAQGSLVVGGFGVNAGDGSNITVNIPSVGRIPNGATVERSVPNNFSGNQPIVFNLNRADFTTANRLATAINDMLGPDVASAIDAVSVAVKAPQDPAHRVDFMALLENIQVNPGEAAARVVINSRTGTIVVGQHVRVSPVAITHGSLTVSVSEDYDVSQPGAFANGQTVVAANSNIDIEQETNPMFKFAPGTTLEDIVRSVNNVGASPSDLMAILEALKQSGALKAELLVI